MQVFWVSVSKDNNYLGGFEIVASSDKQAAEKVLGKVEAGYFDLNANFSFLVKELNSLSYESIFEAKKDGVVREA